MVLACRFWLHNMITHHLSTTRVHTRFYTQHVLTLLTPHLYAHFCPTQLFHTQFLDTLLPTQYLYTQRFYIHSCPIPLFHQQHSHTRLFPAHNFYTPRLYTHAHTLLSPTTLITLLHGTLSRTSLRHAFFAHADPHTSLFSFLPFPSHLHLSLAVSRKKLTCGVIRSFNYVEICRENAGRPAGTPVLCEPAQSKCTWTCHKSHFMRKFTYKEHAGRPGYHVDEPAPLNTYRKNPFSVASLFGG